MKLKDYLRGMGIGVILTAVIMGVALGGSSGKVSDAEVIRRAKQLGMVEAENTLSEYTGAAKSTEEASGDGETASDETLPEEGKEISEEVNEEESETGDAVSEVDEAQEEGSSVGESSESVEAEADIALAASDSSEGISTEIVSEKTEEGTAEEVDGNAQTEVVSTGTVSADNSTDTEPEEEQQTEKQQTEEQSQTEPETEEQTTQEQTMEEATDQSASDVNYVVVVLPGGSESDTCARIIREAGLIDDGVAFNKYLISSGLDRKIRSGTKQIPRGSTFEEIANIITR